MLGKTNTLKQNYERDKLRTRFAIGYVYKLSPLTHIYTAKNPLLTKRNICKSRKPSNFVIRPPNLLNTSLPLLSVSVTYTPRDRKI